MKNYNENIENEMKVISFSSLDNEQLVFVSEILCDPLDNYMQNDTNQGKKLYIRVFHPTQGWHRALNRFLT